MAEQQHDLRRKPPKPAHKPEQAEKLPNSNSSSLVNDTIRLQSLIGNQAVQRLMAQGRATLPSGTTVQAKLTVTSADNAYEREADSVAEQVVSRMAAGKEETQTKRDPQIAQRAEDEEMQAKRDPVVVQRADDEEMQMMRDPAVVQRADDEEMQRSPTSFAESFDVDNQVEQQIKAEQGRGQAMPADLQRSMGGAFGADFSNVRIHTDSVSNDLNSQVGARAFTTGSDLFFKEGEYKPDTADGKKLLAHELTHTIQQNAVSRKQQGDE